MIMGFLRGFWVSGGSQMGSSDRAFGTLLEPKREANACSRIIGFSFRMQRENIVLGGVGKVEVASIRVRELENLLVTKFLIPSSSAISKVLEDAWTIQTAGVYSETAFDTRKRGQRNTPKSWFSPPPSLLAYLR